MRERLVDLLSSPRLGRWLIGANVLVTIALLWMGWHVRGPDYFTYLSLAEGINFGHYSMWWWLPVEVPDTMRTPGYPLFVWLFTNWTTSLVPLKIAQSIAHGAAMCLMYLSVGRMGGGLLARNLFLLLLLPSLNIAWYAPQVAAETLTILFMSAWLYVQVSWPVGGWRKPVVQALLLAAAFNCRPAVLLFPFLWCAIELWRQRDRRTLRSCALHLSVLMLLLLPYGMWNKRHHGVFSLTPLESGGGVIHIGWWSDKIPGHKETRYWGNATSQELIQFTPPEDVQANWTAYQAEWDRIDSAVAPLLTHTDSVMLEEWKTNGWLFRAYNARYTIARERLLKQVSMEHAMEEPVYTLAVKAYMAVRLWVTGLLRDQWENASTIGRIGQLYMFMLTLTIFLLALFAVPMALARKYIRLGPILPALVPVVYLWLIHLPFCQQARYTIPVRAMLLALIAIALAAMLSPRREHEKPGAIKKQ